MIKQLLLSGVAGVVCLQDGAAVADDERGFGVDERDARKRDVSQFLDRLPVVASIGRDEQRTARADGDAVLQVREGD